MTAPATEGAVRGDPDRLLPPGFAEWRASARAHLLAGIPPSAADWRESQLSLAPALASPAAIASDMGSRGQQQLRVSREYMALAVTVACHRDAARWNLLYGILWRLTRGEPQLLSVATDPDVHAAHGLARAVRRAAHKMKAFVRFRRVESTDGSESPQPRYVAWFEPAHLVVERVAPFFARRFASMHWSILTPDRCAHWDGAAITLTEGVPAQARADDAIEDLWREYYANIFNPARLAQGAMRAEMPKSYWKNLPEARLIPDLARNAPARVAEMIVRAASAPQAIPAEYRAPAGVPDVPRRVRTSAAPPVPAARRSALDIPSWDPVFDPGPEVARARADALPPGTARAVKVGDVTVMPGVAGWTDPTLLAPGVFYPADATTPEHRLRFYASRYAMVEVDSTYYVMPSRANSVAWVQRTPADFVFNVKANALMTNHPADVRRLPDWLRRVLPGAAVREGRVYGSDLPVALMDEVWSRFLEALQPLVDAGKLGAVFLQFPRWFEPGRASENLLQHAARRLGAVRGAIEFRNPAWVAPATSERAFALLRDLRLAYTIVDAPPGTRSSMPPVARVTRPDFAVLRLHGRRVDRWEARNEFVTERYRYLYTRAQTRAWAQDVRLLCDELGPGMLQVAYNNNHANYATTNAAEFGEELTSA